MKRSVVLIFICFLLIGCSERNQEISSKKEEGNTITLPDGTLIKQNGVMKLAENSYSHGLRDPLDNHLIHPGDILHTQNGKIVGTINLQQNVPREEIEYSLIILVDYQQQKFNVNNEEYIKYSFPLKEEDIVNIDFELPSPQNAKIFTYLIVYGTDLQRLTFDSKENKKFLTTDMFFTTSCYLDNYEDVEKEQEFSDELREMEDMNIGTPFLTKNLEECKVMPSCNSGDKDIKLVFSNLSSDIKTYTMLAFTEWKQTPIHGETYKLVKLEANKSYFSNIEIPEVKEPSSYQIFMLENPFHPTINERCLSTLRTIIQPSRR